MAKKKRDYPIPLIKKMLEHYALLAAGRWFETGDSAASTKRAPFEAAAVAKGDIDSAIDALDHEEQVFIRAKYIVGGYEELQHHVDTRDLGRRAIRHMAVYLNGECVLSRWCIENGLADRPGHTRIPDYLPPEMQQFAKEICIKFCVLEDCPD